VNCISDCVLNVLNDNIALTGCDKLKLRKHKLALRKRVDIQITLQGLIVQMWRIPSTAPGSGSAHAGLSHFSQVTIVMLRKMYLVPAEDYRPSPPAERGRKRPIPRRRRRQRTTKQQPHTEWIKLRTKHREAGLRRNARTKEIADYMKQIMPAATNPPSPTSVIQLPKLKE